MPDEVRKAKYFGGPDDEQLYHESIDEYIEATLDDMYPGQPEPATLVVVGYVPMKASTWPEDWVLEPLLENLDENYGNPDGDPTEPTEGMKKAARAFIDAVLAEYRVWACEEVTRETINIAEWRGAHG